MDLSDTFEVGRTYMHHSGWTAGRVNKYTIHRRTKCFVYYMEYGVECKKKIYIYNNVEHAKLGNWANAGVIKADCYIGGNTAMSREWERIDIGFPY